MSKGGLLKSNLLYLALLLTLVVYTNGCENCGPIQAGQVQNIQGAYRAIPVYPGSVQIAEYQELQDAPLFIGKRYKAAVSFEGLRKFYLESLKANGWQLQEESGLEDWGRDFGGRQMIFIKGKYTLFIQYAGERADYAWNYIVDVKMECL